MSASDRTLLAAEQMIRSLLTQQVTPAEIAQALANAQLLNPAARGALQAPAVEPALPRCEACGCATGPWKPDPSGARYLSGAQVLVCSAPCETQDNPNAGSSEQLMVWRAEADTIPLGTYSCREDAQAHAEADYRAHLGDQPGLTWHENSSEEGLIDLWVREDGEDNPTTYSVVPVPVLNDYDPDGES